MSRSVTRHGALLLILLALSCPLLLASAAADVPPPAPGPPPIQPPPPTDIRLPDRNTFRFSPLERVAPGIYRMGDIEVNKRGKTVSFPAEINMDRGMLEYLLVRVGGKTHESLLRTSIEPLNLQVACLLLDLEGTTIPGAHQGSPEIPTGDPLAISIVLPDGRKLNPEQWMVQSLDGVKKDPSRLKWTFTGSIVKGGKFGSQVTGSMIAVYRDPVAMIDNASPGGEINGSWFVKEGAVPAVGTPVTVVIGSLK